MFKSKWGQWTDISTGGSLGSYRYILQARRHKNGKLQMRVCQVEAYSTVAHPTIEQLKQVTFKSE